MNFDEYKVKSEYPKPVSKKVCQNCKVSVREDNKFCGNCGVDLAALRAPLIKEYDELRYEYKRDSESKLDSFWADTLEHFGFSDGDLVVIPIHRIKSLAWDKGHSAGLSEVFGEFEDLVAEATKLKK